MIKFKSIINNLKKALIRTVGLSPITIKAKSDSVSNRAHKKSTLEAKSSVRPKAITGVTISNIEYDILLQEPIQLSALQRAVRDASKVYFSQLEPRSFFSIRTTGVHVHGNGRPLPLGVQKAREILTQTNNN